TTEIYTTTDTLSLHDALPISNGRQSCAGACAERPSRLGRGLRHGMAAGRRVALGATGWATRDAGWSAAGERRYGRSDLEGELWAVMGGFGRYGAVWRLVQWWSAVQRTVRYRRLPPITAPTFTPN